MFSLKHIEKWSSLLIVRTLIYFSIALETAIGPMMFPRKSGHEDKRIVYNITFGGI